MQKIKEWLRRYLPAEILAGIGAISGASLFYLITNNEILSAYAGTIGDNIGYYTFISLRDCKKNKLKYTNAGKKFGWLAYLKTLRDLIFEFGPAEALDSLLIRPFCLYWFSKWTPNYAIGILSGKIVADIIFYVPTIFSYELKKKYLKH